MVCLLQHLYMWPCIGSIHLWLLSRSRRGKPDKIFHSRFLDLRVEVFTDAPKVDGALAAPARRFVHMLPQFDDNYAYLVVDSLEVVHLTSEEGIPGQDPGSRTTTFYFGVLVDPSDEKALRIAIEEINALYYDGRLSLQAVLTTHKHWSNLNPTT
jgi:hypothetical protein